MKKRKGAAVLFIIPFLLFFLLFWLIPFVYGIVMSVSKYSLIQGNRGFVGFANYIKILFSSSMYHKSFVQGLGNTVIFVVLTTPFLVFGSLFLALLLDRLPERDEGDFPDDLLCVLFRFRNRCGGGVRMADEGKRRLF